MHIMKDINMTDSLSNQRLTSLMVPTLNSVSRNSFIPIELVPTLKQEQCTQDYLIGIVSETSIDQLVNP